VKPHDFERESGEEGVQGVGIDAAEVGARSSDDEKGDESHYVIDADRQLTLEERTMPKFGRTEDGGEKERVDY